MFLRSLVFSIDLCDDEWDWFDKFSTLVRSVDLQKVCMLMWGLWKNKNDIIWHNKSFGVKHLANRISSFLCNGQVYVTLFCLMVAWSKPWEGWVKCNVDGAVYDQKQRLGAGWVKG